MLVVVLGGRLSLVAAKRALVDLVRMYARGAPRARGDVLGGAQGILGFVDAGFR